MSNPLDDPKGVSNQQESKNWVKNGSFNIIKEGTLELYDPITNCIEKYVFTGQNQTTEMYASFEPKNREAYERAMGIYKDEKK